MTELMKERIAQLLHAVHHLTAELNSGQIPAASLKSAIFSSYSSEDAQTSSVRLLVQILPCGNNLMAGDKLQLVACNQCNVSQRLFLRLVAFSV